MNVNGIGPAAAAVALQGSAGRTSVPTSADSEKAASSPRVDKFTGEPIPPPFPWLSNLTMALEKASNRPSPYGPTAPIGENVDQKI